MSDHDRLVAALERLADIHELDFIVRHADRTDRARVVEMTNVMASAYLQKYENLIAGAGDTKEQDD